MVDLTNYHLTFDDEFNGTALDTTKWTVWANKEHSGYTSDQMVASNVTESGGQLHLAVNKGGTTDGRPYSSAMIDSSGKFAQQYGYMEASIKVPNAKGIWPAFWTFPQSGQWTHEIDIMEMYLADRFTNNTSLHFPTNNVDQYVTNTYTGPDFSAGFHTFGVEWTPSTVIWSVDGIEEFRTTQNTPTESMFMVLNNDTDPNRPWNAVDSTTPFPNTTDVDWVHVYAANTAPSPPPPVVTPHTLALLLSEDAFKGDAKFIVKVDGKALNSATAVTASHAAGVTQEFDFTVSWAAGTHDVEIDFTNDKSGGSPSMDRNLYVQSVTYDGKGYLAQPTELPDSKHPLHVAVTI